MHAVLVAILPVLIVALVVIVAYIITVAIIVTVTVVVLFAFSIARRPLFTIPGTVSPLAVRTTAVVLIVVAFAILAVLLIGGTVLFIGRVPSRLVGLRRGRLAYFLYIL